jgi:hypothetical protein
MRTSLSFEWLKRLSGIPLRQRQDIWVKEHKWEIGKPRDYSMIYRRPGFLAIIRFGSSPAPSPPLPSARCLYFSVFLCVASAVMYWRNREREVVGKETNHTTARQPAPLYIIQFSLGKPHRYIINMGVCWEHALISPHLWVHLLSFVSKIPENHIKKHNL